MLRVPRSPWLAAAIALGAVTTFDASCAATNESELEDPPSTTSGTSPSGQGGQGASITIGVGQGGGTPTGIGALTGTVVAPEGTIPIAGALVYLSTTVPDSIPGQVYCDRCVELENSIPYTFSEPDGSFRLPVYSAGAQYLVVQKGQFRRVREITTLEGEAQVPLGFTTLPGRTDAASGDTVPKMAIVDGTYDDIGSSLAKLGIDEAAITDVSGWPGDPNQFHIIFTPCDSSSGIFCDTAPSASGAVQSSLRQFVEAGGKIYVTDYSYDYIAQTWPEYISWYQQTGSFGSACLTSSYDAPAVVDDPDMMAWLAAQGITDFTLEANWTRIESLNTVSTTDVDGNPTMVTPKAWVNAQTQAGLRPATVSFENGCGRVLFSTYHTEGGGAGAFLAQEKALLYVLLEVGVCVGAPVPR